MNYWLDIRLKIRDFFRKHKKKIIIIVIVWAVVFAINYYLKHHDRITTPQTTYEPHSPVMDTTDKVPEKYKEPISNLIHNFIEYCNNREYENAYNLLSSEFKDRYCKNIDDFKVYVENTFPTKKIYNIQNFSNINKTYIYRVRLLDDILANGTTDEYSYTEQKYVIKEENGILKLSLLGYCGSQDLNIEVEDENLRINIVKKYMQYDESTYVIKFTNKTENYIVLADSSTSNEFVLKVQDKERTAKNMAESNLVISPNETYTREISFDEYFDDKVEPTSLKFNAIKILPEFSGLDENIEKETENAIKLYSLTVDLIAKNRN